MADVQLIEEAQVSQRRGGSVQASPAWSLLTITTNLALWYFIALMFVRAF